MANPTLEFIGFDLGHGETAIARAGGTAAKAPTILDVQGEKSFVTAVAKTGRGHKNLRVGAQAVNLAALGGNKDKIWTKFKSRDVSAAHAEPVQLFTSAVFKILSDERKIGALKDANVLVGCPSGWSEDERAAYARIIRGSGIKNIRTAAESRAALMTAIEQGHLSLEAARGSVLIIDIGSSTTDFTYCTDMQAEDVGHNALGSGLLDQLIFERCLARQSQKSKIEKLIAKYPFYRPVMEYWCRQAKEAYFDGNDTPVEMIKRLPVAGGTLFEIRIDQHDADAIISQKIPALNGFTWPGTFEFALRETLAMLAGRAPQTILLTGGASRLPLILPACEAAFPDANVFLGAEPEFAIARGLAWLGRFEHLHASFLSGVETVLADEGPINNEVQKSCQTLGAQLAPVLVDALIDACIVPTFASWRTGAVRTLADVETALDVNVQSWLASANAQETLRPHIEEWFASLQRQIETHTDPLCRDHGMPAMVLSLHDSAHISRHLEGLSVAAPKVASLEADTALAGTTISAILVSVLLAKANLLAPILANPIGLVIGGAAGIGSYFAGKKAMENKVRSADVPKIARQLLTNSRVRKAANGQREELISAVKLAWDQKAARGFSDEMITALRAALLERADERAILFLL